jgi:hypothetical protein
MTKQEALKKLEGKTGMDKWLFRKLSGEFAIKTSSRDPYWLSEAIHLLSNEQINAAAEWMVEVTA